MAQSRLDRLIKVLGGEGNLPRKLPTPEETTTISSQDETNSDPKLQPIDEVLDGDDWWNRPPKITQAAPASHQQSRSQVSGSTDAVMTPAPLGMTFCPLAAITKFPYKFVKSALRQPIATAFFDEGKIWTREWEVYSVFSTVYETEKPILFVLESQVQVLIDEINTTFPEAKVNITSDRYEGLILDFDDIPQPELRPHFLGNSTSKAQIENLQNICRPLNLTMAVPDRTLKAFKEKIEAAIDISRKKNQAKKQQKKIENDVKKQLNSKLLNRTRWYLGLPSAEEHLTMKNDSLMPDIADLSVSGLDVSKPVSGTFKDDVVFIAVDVEAFEFPPNPITEVGVATLDTRDLHSKAPGVNGEDWQKYITARHFRIEEHKNKTNQKFVDGCPDKFEFNDGISTFVQDRNISKAVSDCFRPPYGKDYPAIDSKLEKRKIVLVGHDINQDINYLRRIGVSVANFSFLDTIDTASLFQVYKKQLDPRALGTILAEFNLMGWNLHNAGNDAVYTLWAMLAICVKSSTDIGSEEADAERKLEEQGRMDAAAEQGRERVKEELEGWENDGKDSGEPVRPGVISTPQEKEKVLYTAGGKILDI